MVSFLYAVYIGAAVFGLGVTIIDLFGLIGDQGDDGVEDAVENPELDDGDVDGDDVLSEGENVSLLAHDINRRKIPLLKVFTVLRNLIYFCLGFGPVGIAGMLMDSSPLASLLWSVPVGLIVLVGARALRRVLKKDLNSAVATSELLMETGSVIVTIGAGQMGKVRIRFAGGVTERYARLKDPRESLAPGTPVQVIEVDEECVYVKKV